MKKILLIAGEISGDMHAGYLAEEMIRFSHEKGESIQIYGVGGNKMHEAGVILIENIISKAIIGFVEAMKNIVPFYFLLRKIRDFIKDEKIELVVFVDFSGFNLRLASMIDRAQTRLAYYFCPQVWASREYRAKTIAKLMHHIIAVFPFEVDLYKKYNANLSYFGHPLIDIAKLTKTESQFRKEHNISDDKKLISLLPGSRKGEIERLVPVMAEASSFLLKENCNISFLLGAVENCDEFFIYENFKKYGIDIKIIKNDTYNLVNASDFAWVASGTATLETAILNTPMIVLYKTSWLTGYLARKVITLKDIGLVNIVAGKRIVPELIQEEATSQKLFIETKNILTDLNKVKEIKELLNDAVKKLGVRGTIKKVSEKLLGDIF